MAHSCPECGLICYCGSDIDDCLLDFAEDQDNCDHCVCRECGETMEWCICDPEEWEDEE